MLIRFRLNDGDSPAIDDASITTWNIARGLEAALNSEGLSAAEVATRKIEGLTIRESKDADGRAHRELFIGLREPKDKVRVFMTDISTPPSPDADLELKLAFAFAAEPREGQASELTSLEYVPALGGFLVVTASEDKANAFHGNTLWFVADGETSQAKRVATFEVAMKAEGLAILGCREGWSANGRQAPLHLRQRRTCHSHPESNADGHARSRNTLTRRSPRSENSRRAVGSTRSELSNVVPESVQNRFHGDPARPDLTAREDHHSC